MNNKIIDYDKAVKRLKVLERVQKLKKRFSKSAYKIDSRRFQSESMKDKKEINYLLSIIASEKKARKLYAKLNSYKELYEKSLPCLPDGNRSGYGYND